MKKLAWVTDLHLNFLDQEAIDGFVQSLAQVDADAFLLTGDVGEAPDVTVHLNNLDTHLARPLYFVLGNHDFYRGSLSGVRTKVAALCSACPNLHWMPRNGVVRLTGEPYPGRRRRRGWPEFSGNNERPIGDHHAEPAMTGDIPNTSGILKTAPPSLRY